MSEVRGKNDIPKHTALEHHQLQYVAYKVAVFYTHRVIFRTLCAKKPYPLSYQWTSLGHWAWPMTMCV